MARPDAVVLPERWDRIVRLVQDHERATVEQIAQALGISPPTVRRDLVRLESRGLIRRTWGGAEPARALPPGITLAESRRVNPLAKAQIGRAAAALVGPGECILLDGGFTTHELARQLEVPDVTVVTNSLDVARLVAARRESRLVVLGGQLLPESGTLVGPATQRQLADLVADRAFLGANAVSAELGLCADIELTAATKRAMVAAAGQVVVVADHSKLGRSALYRVAPVEAIAVLVTDSRAEPASLEAFRRAGVEVLVAAPDPDGEPAAGSAAVTPQPER